MHVLVSVTKRIAGRGPARRAKSKRSPGPSTGGSASSPWLPWLPRLLKRMTRRDTQGHLEYGRQFQEFVKQHVKREWLQDKSRLDEFKNKPKTALPAAARTVVALLMDSEGSCFLCDQFSGLRDTLYEIFKHATILFCGWHRHNNIRKRSKFAAEIYRAAVQAPTAELVLQLLDKLTPAQARSSLSALLPARCGGSSPCKASSVCRTVPLSERKLTTGTAW